MVHPIAEANDKSPFGSLTPSEFYARHSVAHSSDYITNPRGMKLFTQSWTPLPPTKIAGTVAIVHGFTGETSWFLQLTAVLFAKSGFATCAVDHQGHGFSEGLANHIPDVNPVVDDCVMVFDSFRARHAPSMPSFLYGESLGGAIVLLIVLRGGGGRQYDGIVLNGGMCGISDKFKPPWPLEHFLSILAAVAPTWQGETSWFLQLTAVLFAKSGFATCAVDHQGHGFSEGLSNHIPDVNPAVDDCVMVFDSFHARHAPSMPSFLYGESLGGAIVLLIVLRGGGGRQYDGIVLNGGMCGISDKFKPPWPLEHFLSILAAVAPTWQVVPTRGSIPDVSFKADWKRRLALASPRRSTAKPRSATAQELIRICREVQSRFSEVDVPFLIVHGGDDVVCDPACAEELYKKAASKDKTIRVYPGMWHQLIGEPDENVELVFGEVVEWLRTRAERAASCGGEEAETAVEVGGD